MSLLKCLVCLLLVALLPLSACSRSPEQQTSAQSKTVVTFLHYFTDSLSGGIQETAKTFNSQGRSFELKPVPLDHEAFKTSIRKTLEAGNPPDLYSYWAGARTESILDQLEPLDDIWNSHQLDARFSPTLVRAACEYGGHKYLIPLTQHYVGIFYNKRIFAEHGITPPATWEEFLKVCERLKRAGVIPLALGSKDKWPAQFWFDLIMLRSVPYEFRQKLMHGSIGYDDQRVTAVFERWSHLVAKGYFNQRPNDLAWDSGASELVFNGKAAMTLMGTWLIGYYGNDAHKWVAGKDFDFFPFPVIDSRIPLVSLGPIDGLVVPKKAINKEGAKEIAAFMTTVPPQQAMSHGSGSLAPNITVPRSFYDPMQQRILDEISRSAVFAFAYDLSTPPEVAELGLKSFSEFLEFPEQYRQIQSRLASEARKRFPARQGQVR